MRPKASNISFRIAKEEICVDLGSSRYCSASKFLPLAVEEFSLVTKVRDRSECGVAHSPTRSKFLARRAEEIL